MHIERAIDSVDFASQIIVVDSGSTDRTCEIAKRLGADVYSEDPSSRKPLLKWALTKVSIATQWTMYLEAEEALPLELKEEIRSVLPTLPSSVSGVRLRRRLMFQGSEIRFGCLRRIGLLRLWRSGRASTESDWMDEQVLIGSDTSVTLNHGFYSDNLGDLTLYVRHQNNRSTRKATDLISRDRDDAPTWRTLSRPWIENFALRKLPFATGPLLHFLLRYVLLLGFLDGRAGFAYHFLQSFSYYAMVQVKYVELIRDHVQSDL
jgi:glycosyltransferase involved in cell wall biosynthesis